MLMTNEKAAELTQPGIGSFHDPAPFVAPHLAPVIVALPFVVFPVGRDQLDGSFPQPLPQWIGVVAGICNYPFRLLPRPAFGSRDADLLERGFRKRNFCRRGTFQPNSQRKTLTVDQYHPLRSLAALGFTDCIAPFLAGAKLPSRKVSSHFSKPSASSAPYRKNNKRKRYYDGRKMRRYKRRWIVERTNAWLGQFRRLLVRHEHLLSTYYAFFHLACFIITLRRCL